MLQLKRDTLTSCRQRNRMNDHVWIYNQQRFIWMNLWLPHWLSHTVKAGPQLTRKKSSLAETRQKCLESSGYCSGILMPAMRSEVQRAVVSQRPGTVSQISQITGQSNMTRSQDHYQTQNEPVSTTSFAKTSPTQDLQVRREEVTILLLQSRGDHAKILLVSQR